MEQETSVWSTLPIFSWACQEVEKLASATSGLLESGIQVKLHISLHLELKINVSCLLIIPLLSIGDMELRLPYFPSGRVDERCNCSGITMAMVVDGRSGMILDQTKTLKWIMNFIIFVNLTVCSFHCCHFLGVLCQSRPHRYHCLRHRLNHTYCLHSNGDCHIPHFSNHHNKARL